MRIKEVCEKTGLTDRAIRLYMENGLVSPRQESNYMGRCSYTFGEEDVRILEAVATLRRADFSIADIVKMQQFPQNLPEIVAAHRQKLAEDIAAKQDILSTLEQCDGTVMGGFYELATQISAPASAKSIPKEDSGMNFKDFKVMLKRRIPVLIALLLVLLALVVVTVLCIRTAFASVSIGSQGGFEINYEWSMSAVGQHIVCLLSVLMLFGSAVPLAVYIAGGKRYWLMISAAFATLAIGCLLFMPAADQKQFYYFEFLMYRFTLGGRHFTKLPELLLRSFKYVPIVGGIALAVIGFMIDKPLKDE